MNEFEFCIIIFKFIWLIAKVVIYFPVWLGDYFMDMDEEDEPIMRKGTLVESKIVIQSDDRASGLDDGSPVIQPGTRGTILGKSIEMCKGDWSLKEGSKDCVVVRFNLDDSSTYDYDCHPEELKVLK